MYFSPASLQHLLGTTNEKCAGWFVGSVKVDGRTISNLRYADYVVLMASSMGELQNLVNIAIESSLQFEPVLNSSKTKVIKIVKKNQNAKDADHIIVKNNEIIGTVKDSVYLRTLISNKNDDKRNPPKVMHSKMCNGLINKHLEIQRYYHYYKEKAATHISL